MLQQMEVAELLEDINRHRSERSFIYAVGSGFSALLLMMFGLTMLYSTSYATVGERFFYAQLVWAGISLAAMAGVIILGYRKLGNWSFWLMLVLMVLLAWASFLSPTIKGANRWIIIPGIAMRFQPSEMAKVVLALYGAKVISDNLRNVADWKQWKTLLLPGAMIAAVLALVMAGRDLGTTMLLCAAMVALLVAGGMQKRFFIMPLVALILIFFAIEAFSPERMSRITSFLNPEDVVVRDDDGYQLWNSLLALGSGNWQGIGFMESRMKMRYLPEAHTDFILSIVGEELGFIGMIGVIAGYLLLGWFGMKIAMNSRSRFGMLLATTITMIIVLQAGINIGVVSGALPTKGISAPFISYGGSNLLMNMIMAALLISVGLENVPGLTDNWWGRKK